MGRSYDDTIVYFNKTPPSIVCPHFYELRWAFGCPFDCQWCYLLGTSFGKKHFRAYDLDTTLRHLARALREMQEPQIFNAGELSDSLPNHPNMIAIMDLFETQSRHKLLLLTKTAYPSSLVNKPRKQVIYSCSLNALPVASRWESLAPSPLDRIKAAKQVGDAGYEVRARIDPILPVEGWKEHYAELVRMMDEVPFSRVTLGTLRGLQRTINFARKLGKDMLWTKYFSTTTKWGKKLSDESRLEIYGFMIDLLKPKTVAVCKETDQMIARLGMKDIRCNCVW
jgi:spore photoproduct lyase